MKFVYEPAHRDELLRLIWDAMVEVAPPDWLRLDLMYMSVGDATELMLWGAWDEPELGKSIDANIERIDVFAERFTPDIVTPERLHVRFTVSTPLHPEGSLETRCFRNAP